MLDIQIEDKDLFRIFWTVRSLKGSFTGGASDAKTVPSIDRQDFLRFCTLSDDTFNQNPLLSWENNQLRGAFEANIENSDNPIALDYDQCEAVIVLSAALCRFQK